VNLAKIRTQKEKWKVATAGLKFCHSVLSMIISRGSAVAIKRIGKNLFSWPILCINNHTKEKYE
jgi:hypothetical protein